MRQSINNTFASGIVICGLSVFLGASSVLAAPDQICVYVAKDGSMQQAVSRNKIPYEARKSARCYDPGQTNNMAAPQDVKLTGTTRAESMVSPVGKIDLRWPRSTEQLFGRTPQRAMSDAAGAVSRALKQAGFPSAIQNLRINWNVVFMDENVPETQIPLYLVSNCHPAWMTPVANLYVVGQRVAAGCGGGKSPGSAVADSQLAQVLIHEMGHGVEYQILQGLFGGDRMRAEGFACWFEQYASDFSSVVGKGTARGFYTAVARRSLNANSGLQPFTGSLEDYARASMYFNAIVERRGVSGLMSVYETMVNDRLDFLPAIKKRLGWDQKKLAEEVERVLG